MDRGRFLEHAPGSLVPIAAPDMDWAFVPLPLPRDWILPSEHVALLVDARQSLARLDGAGRHLPAHSILLRPLQRREALRSSALEGTFATAEELLVYGLEPKAPTSTADPANAWREVFNYDAALQRAQKLLKELPLSSRVIRELHKMLLDRVRGSDRTPGVFRTRQVHIGSDRRFVPAPPDRVADLIAELERYMNAPVTTDCLVQAFLTHYQFETIHPFVDGNGRVGRLLLSLMVYIKCGLQSPWLYLSPYFERYKDEYIDRLFAVSTRGDFSGWVAFCLRATVAEANNALQRIDRLLALKAKYEKKLASSSRVSHRLQPIVSHLLGSPLITIPALARQFKVTFPTAQKDVYRLVELGILKESARQSKPQYYVSHEFLEAAYAED
jgi:Fic family protein